MPKKKAHMTKTKQEKRVKLNAANESGSILWIILIAVALLGLLTMVLSRSGSSVDQSGDFEQQRVKVSQILRNAKGIEAATQQMRLRGVSENDISFENPITTAVYTNANCTSGDCKLYNVSGAGLTYSAPPQGVNDASEWIFSGTNNIVGIGTTAPDLVIFLKNITTSTCTQINRMLETSYAGDEDTIDFTPFTGTYIATQSINLAASQQAGCINYDDGSATSPLFYYVLIAR